MRDVAKLMHKMRIPVPHALVSSAFLLMVFVYCLKSPLMLQTTDLWWHLAAGKLILGQHALPFSDPFSFTAGNYPWLNISWLWDILYSALYARGELYLPLAVTALLHAFVMALLVYFLLDRGVGAITTLVTFMLAVVPYSYMMTPTPYQVTLLMTIAFYIIAHKAVAEGKEKLLMVLPLLMILWVNMHGAFFVGYIIIGAYLVEAGIEKNSVFTKLCLALAACMAASLINPLGTYIFAACYRTLSSQLLPIISEWSPLQFTMKYFLYTGYVVLFLILFYPLNSKVRIAEKILSLLWAAAAFKHERNLPVFVLLSAPALALNLQYYASFSLRLQELISRKNAEYEKDLGNMRARKVLFVCSAIVLFLLLGGVGKYFMSLELPNAHPREEALYLKEHCKGLRVLNDYFQGGYLLFALEGTNRIFIDGRAETAYPAQAVSDYLQFYFNASGWEKLLDNYRIDVAVVPRTHLNTIVFFESSSQWRKVFEGRLDNVYTRK